MTISDRPGMVMCRPTHFGVQYVINPWMQGQIGRARNDVAVEQWNRLYEIVASLTNVAVIEGAPALPDMCFVANAGLVVGDRFIPSVFRFPQREPESPLFSDWFADAGYELAPLGGDDTFEGEGDALLADKEADCIWAGYGMRSSLESHQSLTERLNVEVVSLRLVDERFYHLDTCFFPLPGGRAVYYPPAFDEASQAEIRRRRSHFLIGGKSCTRSETRRIRSRPIEARICRRLNASEVRSGRFEFLVSSGTRQRRS